MISNCSFSLPQQDCYRLPKFLDAATQINSDEFNLLTQFSDMGLRVLVQGRKRRSKPKDGKLPLLTYKMMRDYSKQWEMSARE